jgi:hypothetical protein
MSEENKTGAEKRLLPRLTVSHEVYRDSRSGKFFAVADLTRRGMAIRVIDRADFFHFMIGADIEGILNIRREKFQVAGKVRHLGKDLVGIEFTPLPASVEHALASYLDPVILGQDLRAVPTGDDSMLYASTSGTEVLFVRDRAGRCIRLTVMILGSLVQWEQSNGLRTGTIRNSYEESLNTGVTRLDTMLFDEDRSIDPQKLNLAKQLISSSNLSEEMKKFCLIRFEGASA